MTPALSAYLARIGLSGPVSATPEGLARAQRAHREAIAFENLDPMLGRPIELDPAAIRAKLVDAGRGGYCFEHNGLFGAMLAEMGLPSRPLLGRVWLGGEPGTIPPRTHTLRLVSIGDALWLGDAGFGAAWVPPLPLHDGATAQTPDGFTHRLRRADVPGSLRGEWLLERRAAGEASAWEPQYGFDLTEVAEADLAMANHWTGTRPQTRFTSACIVSIVLPDGFAALRDRAVSIQRSTGREAHGLDTPDAWSRAISGTFRIRLPDADARALSAQLYA